MLAFRIDHIGVAVPDMERALSRYADLFGYRLLRGPYDDPQQQSRVAFIACEGPGGPTIELVAPLFAGSLIERILAKGMGLYHICYEVPSIEQAIAQIRSKGCLLISGPTPAVAYHGRPIAWLYTPDRQLTELVEAASPVASERRVP